MKAQKLNSGVIFTNSKCIGCNKCISGCIAIGANVVVKNKKTDKYAVKVDPEKCVLCGHCVEECVHGARTYRDDTDAFFADLKRGENISILVAPSLLTNYEKQYNNILGYLKHMGVRHIFNSGFGADIMVWVYMNFIHDFGLSGVISQFCPVIVNYLEKYKPELLDHLMPVQSPMMCTAIYVSDYLKITDKLAYIGPCIAEKHEITDVNTYGRVSYNITFERLMKRLQKKDISKYYSTDEVGYGLGALVSSAGGLSDNIRPYIGFNKVLIQTSSYSDIFPYFDHYATEVSAGGEMPFLVDALSCINGCNFGTGTICGAELRNQVTFSAYRAKEAAYKAGNVPTGLNYEERLARLNKHFESFETSSFVRQYNNIDKVVPKTVSDEAISAAFNTMLKHTPQKRKVDCGSCGYKTCRDMAYAICTKVNKKENCINYSKERVASETQKTRDLLKEISVINDELKSSTQLKSNFLANMSHEIRTPMNAVIGMAEMALRGELPKEERGYIQQIKASGRSLLAIINDILDFSKIESGKMEINETNYAVTSIINDTVNIVASRIGEKNITLMVDADPDVPLTLRGDDIRIKQVLVNFANNAVKFTESGFVKISMSCERYSGGVYLVIAIEDTGIGIKPEDLDKLFSSFQQVDSKRNRNIEGTGLGLAISREFVRLMGGEIKVRSTYGKGSVFSFRFPQMIIDDVPSVSLKSGAKIMTASLLADEYVREGFLTAAAKLGVANTDCHSAAELRDAVKKGAEFIFIDYPLWNDEVSTIAKAGKRVTAAVIVDPRKHIVTAPYVLKMNKPVYCMSIASVLNRESWQSLGDAEARTEDFSFEAPDAQILIVDDNAINITVAKGLLSPLHMNITAAHGGMEAIRLIEKNKYDIVLMDHMMPDVDGVEATHIIRAKSGDYFKKLPIIALTANAINNAKEMFMNEGMNDFIAKPIEIVDIVTKIKKWLPPEKIKKLEPGVGASAARGEKAPKIEGLDVKSGIAMAGDVGLYKKILKDYYIVIEKKADLIKKYAEEGDLTAYTIQVHALKSASRLIGAKELSELAASLENSGNHKDTETIMEETPELLRRYLEYLPRLEPYCKAEEVQETRDITSEEQNASLDELAAALDDFNIDVAKETLDMLNTCKLGEHEAELREKLCVAVDEIEYDEAMSIVKEWQESLGLAATV